MDSVEAIDLARLKLRKESGKPKGGRSVSRRNSSLLNPLHRGFTPLIWVERSLHANYRSSSIKRIRFGEFSWTNTNAGCRSSRFIAPQAVPVGRCESRVHAAADDDSALRDAGIGNRRSINRPCAESSAGVLNDACSVVAAMGNVLLPGSSAHLGPGAVDSPTKQPVDELPLEIMPIEVEPAAFDGAEHQLWHDWTMSDLSLEWGLATIGPGVLAPQCGAVSGRPGGGGPGGGGGQQQPNGPTFLFPPPVTPTPIPGPGPNVEPVPEPSARRRMAGRSKRRRLRDEATRPLTRCGMKIASQSSRPSHRRTELDPVRTRACGRLELDDFDVLRGESVHEVASFSVVDDSILGRQDQQRRVRDPFRSTGQSNVKDSTRKQQPRRGETHAQRIVLDEANSGRDSM